MDAERMIPDTNGRADGVLPYPEDEVVIPLWPTVGKAMKLGRSGTFDANQRGELPFPVWKIAGKLVSPTAAVREALGLPQRPP
jgi:hypothetical protein